MARRPTRLHTLSRRLFALRKRLRQRLRRGSAQQKVVVFVLGCQRSGTSLMKRVFDADVDTSTFAERSAVFAHRGDGRNRLKPIDAVRDIVERDPAPFVLIKPLMELQNSRLLLESFPGSKAVWIARHYRDVARSNVAKFGVESAHRNVQRLLENAADSWRSEHVHVEVRERVGALYSTTSSAEDAAALFWYARNRFLFDLGLDRHPAVHTILYEDLVTKPRETFDAIYGFVGRPFPGDRIVAEIHAGSLGRGRGTELSPEIARLCEELWERFATLSGTRSATSGA